jgi:hypothetical protein
MVIRVVCPGRIRAMWRDLAESGVVDETLVTIHTTGIMAIRRPRVCSPDGDSREPALLNALDALSFTSRSHSLCSGSRSVDPVHAPHASAPRLRVAAQSRTCDLRCRA